MDFRTLHNLHELILYQIIVILFLLIYTQTCDYFQDCYQTAKWANEMKDLQKVKIEANLVIIWLIKSNGIVPVEIWNKNKAMKSDVNKIVVDWLECQKWTSIIK